MVSFLRLNKDFKNLLSSKLTGGDQYATGKYQKTGGEPPKPKGNKRKRVSYSLIFSYFKIAF